AIRSAPSPGRRERRQMGQRLPFRADLQVDARHAARDLGPQPAADLGDVAPALEVVADPTAARRPALEGQVAVVLDLSAEGHVEAAEQLAHGALGALAGRDHLLLQDGPLWRA